VPLGFITSYALAWLSFQYLERPFLRLKRRLAPQERSHVSLLHVSQP